MRVEKIILAICLVVTFCAYAFAHSWYDIECCSTLDCNPVPPDAVIEIEGGWKHLDTGVVFKDQPGMKRIRPSRDRSFHVCITGNQNEGYVGHCIYILQGA